MQTISPKAQARAAGVLYLIIVAAGLFSEGFVRSTLIVSSDAAKTAQKILAAELLYRLGGAAEFVTISCDIAVAIVLYNLLKPVNQTLALMAAFFRLIFCAVYAPLSLAHFMPLVLLHGGSTLSAFSDTQLQALTMLSFKAHNLGYQISLVFFGIHCLLIGGLIAWSRFLPRALGVLLAIAGACYVFNSFANFIVPPLGALLYPYVLLPGFVAELGLALWLTSIGLNSQRWQEQHAAVERGLPSSPPFPGVST
jgi:hypothetical protein